MISSFTIYLDLVEPLQDGVIAELCELSDLLVVPLYPYENSKFHIERILKEDVQKEELLHKLHSKNISGILNSESFLQKDLLKIVCNTKIPNVFFQQLKDSWSENDSQIYLAMDPVEFNLSYMYDIVKKRVHDLIFAVNLAKIGSLSINKYIIFQDDNKNIMGGKAVSYRDFKEALKDNHIWNYPTIKTLSIKETWNWLIDFPDFLVGFSKSPTTRALINLNEISKSETTMKLFRSVMGLEALYTTKTENLQKQVKEKSQIILGPQTEFKKLYSMMYDFRSKYIHGELNFASGIHLDVSKLSEEYNSELEKSTHFALLILFASIQELIVRNWKGYNFNYTYLVKNQGE